MWPELDVMSHCTSTRLIEVEKYTPKRMSSNKGLDIYYRRGDRVEIGGFYEKF